MTQTKYDKAVSVCFSGHRNIPFLYRKQLKLQLKVAITKAYSGGYRHFYCGCAMGFDMLAAEVALALQSELSSLQVIAVVPYRGQSGHYKIFCVNAKYGIQYGFRIFYLIALQNEENYEREESCSA